MAARGPLTTVNATDSNAPPSKSSASSRPVEQVYQKVSQLEHILLRPDTYVGAVERNTVPQLWVAAEGAEPALEQRSVSYVPGLYKIFDEILVNAADHKQRDSSMDTVKVEIDVENNRISVYNNGAGIPVEMHAVEKVYVPELIFGHLLTSSNYNDNEKKVVGGRNGYGAKLANIFSTEFIIETVRNGKRYKQVFRNNMSKKDAPHITKSSGSDWTKVTFSPDLDKFGMTCLDVDVVALMKKRVMDVAGCNPKVKVYLNGTKLPFRSFKDYVQLYHQGSSSDVIFDGSQERWEVVFGLSESGFTNTSFVNSIWTIKGGTHVTHVVDAVVGKIAEHIAKKNKGLKCKPFEIKNHMAVFVNCLIENPAFDSQTKEILTSRMTSFGSRWTPPEDFVKKIVSKTGIVEKVLAYARFKQSTELKKTDGGKTQRVMGIPKLDDANMAGSRKAAECTLILTEGDSAKALAVSGLSVVGRDLYGVFPLRGKLLNVRDANHKQIADNPEITNLKKILGLQQGKVYDQSTIKSLRYGHVVIMTDQDHDGSHIKGLLINFFDHFWPSLLKIPGFLQEFITPIVKCTKGQTVKTFFTLPEYRAWCDAQPNQAKGCTIKYYKGLGTSTAAEAKEYFSDLKRHLLDFKFSGDTDKDMIQLAFSKQKVAERKEWLSEFEPGTYFDHQNDELTFSNFINKELVLFSVADNERSIPSVMDGFKPSQRKVLFGCFKRKLKTEIKVAQLAGYISEHSAYHHGEAALMGTIMGLAQNYVGSNNINLLVPSGQFGTRLAGGKDAASARYIFTKLNETTRKLFCENDDPVLDYLEDDGMSIEPKYYCPIIPLVLVNGAEGIGTGWATSVPCYNPIDVLENVRRLIRGEDLVEMIPWYRGFNGAIIPVDGRASFDVHGVVYSLGDNVYQITELPVGSWTTPYKEFLEANATPSVTPNGIVKSFMDRSTENTVDFSVSMKEPIDESTIYKVLKLSGSAATSNMVLFDESGKIRKFSSTAEILKEFFTARADLYAKRRLYMLRQLERQVAMLQNKVRFIMLVVDNRLKVAKRKKAELIAELGRLGFEQFANQKNDAEGDEAEEGSEPAAGGYDYLLSMPLWSLTLERVNALVKDRDAKVVEAEALRNTQPTDIWLRDLEALEEVLLKPTAPAQSVAGKKSKKSAPEKKAPSEDCRLPYPVARTIAPKVSRRAPAQAKPRGSKAQSKTQKAKGEGSHGSDDDKPRPVEQKASVATMSLQDGDQSESDFELSLTDRLAKRMVISGEVISLDSDDESNKPKEKVKPKSQRAPRTAVTQASAAGNSPETKTPVPKRTKPAARLRKKPVVSLSSDSSDEEESGSNADVVQRVAPREQRTRRRVATVSYIVSSDDNDNEGDKDAEIEDSDFE